MSPVRERSGSVDGRPGRRTFSSPWAWLASGAARVGRRRARV